MDEKELKKLAKELEKKMRQAAAELNFEEAARLRDRMVEAKAGMSKQGDSPDYECWRQLWECQRHVTTDFH